VIWLNVIWSITATQWGVVEKNKRVVVTSDLVLLQHDTHNSRDEHQRVKSRSHEKQRTQKTLRV